MTEPSIADIFLRQIPLALQDGVQQGTHALFGSIIRNVSNGEIAGFLQETALTPDLLARLAPSGSGVSALDATPLGAAVKIADLGVDVAGHGASFIQNEQIKAAVQVVQKLQVANLLLSAAGLGVSVAGFAIVLARIGRVEDKIDALTGGLDRIARQVESLKRDRIADDLTRLVTTAEQFEEGWSLRDPGPQWRQVATEAHGLAKLFERRADEALDRDTADLSIVEPFTDALALAIAIRVKARLAGGDDLAASRAAEEGALTLSRIGDRCALGEAALARMAVADAKPGSAAWGAALDTETSALRGHAQEMRAREAAAVSAALLIRQLAILGITGRAWLDAARAEHGSPLLFLPADNISHVLATV